MNDKNKSSKDPAVRNERVPQAFAKISDPSNAHLFTADAVHEAFMKVELPSQDEKEELAQVRKQLGAASLVMQQREERRRSKMVSGFVLGDLIAFLLAVLVIIFMR